MNKVSGTNFSYYFICKRKLWLSANGISLEHEHENVKIGKIIDSNSYKKKYKNISINGDIAVDFFDDGKTIHEIKKTNKMEEAHIWQVKYYIYYLTELGFTDIKGVVDYPTLKKKTMVSLKKEEHKEIKEILNNIDIIINNEMPKIDKLRRFCKKCAFHDFCYI